MNENKTLTAYQTKGGATKEAAIKIADVLRSKYQLDVDFLDLKKQKVPDQAQYKKIFIGGGVRAGKVYGKTLKFLEKNLRDKKVAFFVSSSWAGTPEMTMQKPSSSKKLSKYLYDNSVSTEAFGGRIRYFRKTTVDNTDLIKAETWAEQLGKKFTQ